MPIQIIPARRTFGAEFGRALGGGVGKGFSESINKGIEKKQEQKLLEQRKKDLESMGLDPNIANLPKEAQEAYFKQQFAVNKPMTPLQEAQQKLAEERLIALQQDQQLFQGLTGGAQGKISQDQELGQGLGQELGQGLGQEEQGKRQGQGMPQQGGFDISKIPVDKLKQIAAFAGQPGPKGIIGNIAKSELERKSELEKETRQIQNKKTELGLSRDNEILKESDAFRTIIPTEEASLEMMRDGIVNGDQSFFSANNLAEKTGLEWFRDAAGGQFKTGSKTFLINNVSKFGARPNQYIETQMTDALAKVGRSMSANLITYNALKFDSDIKKAFLNQVDTTSEKDFKPGSLGKTVQKDMKNLIEKSQNELYEKFKFIKNHEREIDQTPKGSVPMIDPQGRLVYIPVNEIDMAKFNGAIDL